MKKKILWILLIVLICFAGWLSYLKIRSLSNEDNIEFNQDEAVIEPEKKILSSWVSVERETYNNDQLTLEERYIVSLVIYEETINVCVGSGFNCEELKYIDTDGKIVVEDGTLGFTGDFNKLETEEDNIMNLEQVDSSGNKYIYYFEKPVG